MKLRTNELDTTAWGRSSILRNSTVFSKNGLIVLDSLLFIWSCTSTKYSFNVPDSMIRLCIVADSMIASSISAEMRDSTSVEAFRVCYTSECTPFGLCISTHPCNDRHHTLSMGTDIICQLRLSVLVLILSRRFQININLTVICLSVLKKLIVTGSSLHSLVVGFHVIDTIRGWFALLYETDVLRVGLGWQQLNNFFSLAVENYILLANIHL